MKNTDTIHEMWSIVRNNNRLFRRRHAFERFGDLLRVVVGGGVSLNLLDLLVLYLHANAKQKSLLAGACLPWLREAVQQNAFAFDEQLRQAIRYSGEPSLLLEDDLSSEQTLFQASIQACHPNGRVREKAVAALARFSEPLNMSLVLVRCNDWVAAIRSAAQKSAFQIMARMNADDFVSTWGVFERSSYGKRYGGSMFKDQLNAAIHNKMPTKLLHKQLNSTSSQARRYAATIMWNSAESLNYSDLHALCSNSDPYICFRTLKDVIPDVYEEFKIPLLDLVRRKKWAPARLERLRILLAGNAENITNELTGALCDRSGSIRNFARYHLSHVQPAQDYVAYYQAALSSENITHRIAALRGLHEVDPSIAEEAAAEWLLSPEPRIVSVALELISTDTIEAYSNKILSLLSGDTPQLNKAAYTALRKNPPAAGDLFQWFDKDNIKGQRLVYLAKLILKQGRWESFAYALRLVRHTEEDIRELANWWIESFIDDLRSSWVKPSTEELRSANREWAASSKIMTSQTVKEIRHLLDSYHSE